MYTKEMFGVPQDSFLSQLHFTLWLYSQYKPHCTIQIFFVVVLIRFAHLNKDKECVKDISQ